MLSDGNCTVDYSHKAGFCEGIFMHENPNYPPYTPIDVSDTYL